MEKHVSRLTTKRAENNGHIKRDGCAKCGSTENLHIHHNDYDKPLDVTCLCATCHHIEHHPFHHECKRCMGTWWSALENPLECQICRSRKWQIAPELSASQANIADSLECLRCASIWVPRRPNPAQCPRCKSPYWNKPKKETK